MGGRKEKPSPVPSADIVHYPTRSFPSFFILPQSSPSLTTSSSSWAIPEGCDGIEEVA